ncbi:cytochrome P450, partial [Thamnocephalis sphaerospora]
TILPAIHFIYDVASNPEMREKMHKEQQKVLAQHGTAFIKEALQDMTYLDACLRETLRLNTNAVTIYRKTARDMTFSNGVCIPAGRLCFLNMRAVNRSSGAYNSASGHTPDSKVKKAVEPDFGYVTFGAGRKACPGRFFAVGMLKSLIAWLLRSYDF